MALSSTAIRLVFLRAIYRNADPETAAGRSAYLDALDDTIMRQVTAGGRRLISSSSTGSQFTFDWAQDMDLETLAELSNWAREYIASDTVEEALALVKGPVRVFRSELSCESHYG